jgi:hypothetical protein
LASGDGREAVQRVHAARIAAQRLFVGSPRSAQVAGLELTVACRQIRVYLLSSAGYADWHLRFRRRLRPVDAAGFSDRLARRDGGRA